MINNIQYNTGRAILIIAAFTTLGVCMLMRFQGPSSNADFSTLEVQEQEGTVVEPGPDLEEVGLVSVEKPRRSEDRSAVSGIYEGVSERDVPAEQAGFTLSLAGTVIGGDVEGNQWTHIDGEITFFASWDGGARYFQVPFRRGEWSSSIELPAVIKVLSIEELSINGRNVFLEAPRGDLQLPLEGELEIRARMPQLSTLRVVDAGSGRHLSGVRIVSARGAARQFDSHPGVNYQDRTMASGLDSPISLAPYRSALKEAGPFSRVSDPVQILVGARGYAWRRVPIDFLRGGEKQVSLRRAATLTVSVRGVEASARSKLRLRYVGEDTVTGEVDLNADGFVELEGLTPGNLRITGEVGNSWEAPVVLAENWIELQEGGHSRVDLYLSSAPDFTTVLATGIIHLAQEWNPERKDMMNVSVELHGTALAGFDYHQVFRAARVKSTLEGFDTFRWTAPELQVGTYSFHLIKLPLDVDFDVLEGGAEPFEWVLPPPVEYTLRLRDDVTLEDVTVDKVRWASSRAEGLDIRHCSEAVYDHERHGYLIRSPVHRIDLGTWSEDFANYMGTIQLRPGVREHTIHLSRSFGVIVRLQSGGKTISFPGAESVRQGGLWGLVDFAAVLGAGRVVRSRSEGVGRRFTVNEPGDYNLAFNGIPGFRTPAPQLVRVSSSGFTEVVIELERE